MYIKSKGKEVIGDYVIGKLLGTGQFGVVRLGTHLKTNKQVAIKIVNKERTARHKATELITREISILKKVKHPNVIECYEVIETGGNWYMIMEYVSGGELLNYISNRVRLSEYESSLLFSQIISAVDYLHKQGNTKMK